VPARTIAAPSNPTGVSDSPARQTAIRTAHTGSVPSISATRAGELRRTAQTWSPNANTVQAPAPAVASNGRPRANVIG